MRKFVLIPTRDDKGSLNPLRSFFEDAGYEVHFLIGESSIFSAYQNTIDKLKVKAKDTVIMCHDDIEILTKPSAFNSILDKALNSPNVGFVGVAGTKILKPSAIWWDGVGTHDHFAGTVFHGKNIEDMFITPYGNPGPVVVADGLFLAAKGSTLNSIQLKKPKSFPGDWDFYDIFYTYQAHRKGLVNMVAPIQILHESVGELAGRDSWHDNKKAFLATFSQELPAVVH